MNCPACDRPLATREEWETAAAGGRPDLCWGGDDCRANAVDWRRRAMEAEGRVAALREAVRWLSENWPGTRVPDEVDRAVNRQAGVGQRKERRAMTEDDFNGWAWANFVQWAMDQEDFHKAFTEATGMQQMPPPRNGLERMIDEAAGVHREYVTKFVAWVTVNHWGIEYAPKRYREYLEKESRC